MKDPGDHSVNIRLYLDNELTGPDLENFLAHLKKCVACRRRLSAEEELTSLRLHTHSISFPRPSGSGLMPQLTPEA
jgi:Putative zinc-finger